VTTGQCPCKEFTTSRTCRVTCVTWRPVSVRVKSSRHRERVDSVLPTPATFTLTTRSVAVEVFTSSSSSSSTCIRPLTHDPETLTINSTPGFGASFSRRCKASNVAGCFLAPNITNTQVPVCIRCSSFFKHPPILKIAADPHPRTDYLQSAHLCFPAVNHASRLPDVPFTG